ncbi:uncharacterized protein TRAVEDRAFT_73164 [Trametes versicolor FP-101664 SS1]|uniref:uncharacterized protein n=1 Tax=Trametes versicolor (strain FP-101664) TaxID=717944 RepID=UPI0004624357|nr:uncharacterized protein TRAVEDRAFT_73164 [Trametes versicolor FP-101664 SS1]EIW56723.1 hypothetical protein TRAVEDRAFT_73164 [Trametes versicolor FP-101664 SS1]
MTADASAAKLLTIAESNHINRVFAAIAFGILWYDFVLTIPIEVERYWKGGRSWAAIFYFLNRYLSVLSHIPVVVEFFAIMPESRCRKLQLYHQVLAALTQFFVGVLLMLRTYALYNRNRKVVYLLASICAAGGAVSVWAIVSVRSLHLRSFQDIAVYTGCDLTLSEKQGYYLAAAWSSILVFDATVFVLTLTQALRVGRMFSHSLFHIMLRDGTIYFGILVVCYGCNILTYILAQPVYKGVSTTFTNVISTTLITRLMLNIRDPKLVDLPHRWPSELLEI